MLTILAVVEVNKATIGALVLLLKDGKGQEKKEAATVLYAICLFRDNRRRAVQYGAVPIFLIIADSGLDRAVEVLGLLRFNRCVRILVRVLRNGSSRGIQYALLTFNPLCLYSEEMCGEARREGVLEICMGFLDDENEKIRRSTSNLIEVLIGNHLMR
ncbi:hypothetical protein UlMin_000155 [Ulmus minor]